MKLWSGMLSGNLDKNAEEFNASIKIDKRLVFDDIRGSIAHVKMLAKTKILTEIDSQKIINGLEKIYKDLKEKKYEIDLSYEDIHSFIEAKLIEEIGEAGKKMHTARSRNDQVTTDFKLNLRGETKIILDLLKEYVEIILALAEKNKETVMPGYTHLQAAQPITFAHHMLCYANMALRDIDRIKDFYKRLNLSPLGACALAGTTYKIDREFTAKELNFDGIVQNSIDAVSDRDYVLEMHSAISQISIHLSRLAEEIVIWSSQPFKFINLHDSFVTGSSIMPQKKNPDMAELVRGKSAKIIANMNQAHIMLKGLFLSYSKDLQEDKEALFDSIDNIKLSIEVTSGMLNTLTVNKERMFNEAKHGFINATDLADYLVGKGVSFREAHHICAKVVNKCIQKNIGLEDLSLQEYKEQSNFFDKDLFNKINLLTCVQNRKSKGGPSPIEVTRQIDFISNKLKNL